jgi:NAD(P)H-dependent FMN reductase
MPKILAIAGSYREHSYNKRVLRITADSARNAGADVTVIDLRDFPMPVFNADDVEKTGFDGNALRFQDVLNEHEGFLICSPEYNGSIPGGFKTRSIGHRVRMTSTKCTRSSEAKRLQ